MTSPAVPTKIGKYEITRLISRGSMGLVYLGHDPFLNRPVAVKTADAGILNDQEKGSYYRRLFYNEAYTAGMLNHPNILAIYDAGLEGDECYIAMEYVPEGKTLKSYCRPDHLLPIRKVIEIVFKCARALDHAHRKGVVHRDIKPSNLLLTPEPTLDLKLADFSIAYHNHPDMAMTQPLGMVGSPLYMSPEQVREEGVTHHTDLFSLGVVFYELLTGKHPFKADSLPAVIYRILNETAPPLESLVHDISPILVSIVNKAMAKNHHDRYQSGHAMATDLSLAFHFLDHPQEELSLRESFQAVKNIVFFQDFTEPEIWEVVRAARFRACEEGESILKEGEIEETFYIIVEGSVLVYKGEESIIGKLIAGDCFGEMGYLTKTPRTASICAETPVVLMKISATSIEQLSTECQLRFHKIFLRTLIERLSRTTAQLTTM